MQLPAIRSASATTRSACAKPTDASIAPPLYYCALAHSVCALITFLHTHLAISQAYMPLGLDHQANKEHYTARVVFNLLASNWHLCVLALIPARWPIEYVTQNDIAYNLHRVYLLKSAIYCNCACNSLRRRKSIWFLNDKSQCAPKSYRKHI